MIKINEYIDHTNLNLQASHKEIKKLCSEAKKYSFPAVCVAPNHVQLATNELAKTNVHVCTVIGFPNGYQTTLTKIFETAEMIKQGAIELDVVLNLQNVADKEWNAITHELRELRSVTQNKIIKLIIEASILTKEEIITICKIGCQEKIDYLKTSTGFNGKARLEDVILMKEVIGERAKIKAAGGIRNQKDALAFIEAGAHRLGTSSGLKIIEVGK